MVIQISFLNFKIKRLTYFTRNDEDEAVPIKDAKGVCCNWCVGADLNEDNVEEIVERKVFSARKQEKIAKKEEKARRAAMKRVEQAQKKNSFFKTAFFWICGIEKQMSQPDFEQTSEQVDTSIEQNRFWAVVCDINAIIAMALSAFCFAFFNVYTN